jgi:hypothetical protein
MLLCGTFEPLDRDASPNSVCKQGRYALNNCGGPMHWYILQELPQNSSTDIIWSVNYSPEYRICYIFSSYYRDILPNMQEYSAKYPLLLPLIQKYNFIPLGQNGIFVLLSGENIEEITDLSDKYEPDELGGHLEYFEITSAIIKTLKK